MKRPYISLLSAIVVASMTLTACGNSTNSDKDNNSCSGSEPPTGVEPAEPDAETSSGISEGGSGTELFTDILDAVKEATVFGEGIEEDGYTGINEIVVYGGDDRADILGYSFLDLNGDGRAELLIGDMREGTVVAVFSAKGSASPECILEGWARNRFKLQKDGSFINNGSSGAEYSSISRYLVARDGGSTECVETYFTNPGIDGSDLIVYRSNSESQDPSAAEKVGSSWDDYEKCCARLEGEEYAVEFTPFSEYKDRSQRLNDGFQNSLKVSGIFLDGEPDSGEKFIAADAEYATWVEFEAIETVKDFKVLAIEWKGEADNGGFIFSSKELFGKEKFKKGETVAVKMAMEGSIPNNGISYISPDGTSMEMSLSQSGMDGSLVFGRVTIDD